MEFEISGISGLAQKERTLTTEQCLWSCDFTQITNHTLEPVKSCEVIACSFLQQGIWDKTYSCGEAQMVCFRYVSQCCHGCSITKALLSPFFVCSQRFFSYRLLPTMYVHFIRFTLSVNKDRLSNAIWCNRFLHINCVFSNCFAADLCTFHIRILTAAGQRRPIHLN